MFEELARFPRIVVSGPHRAGTTIAAKMIAADTGLRLAVEEDFAFSDESKFRAALERGGVLQAPFFAHLLHTLPADALVVWMIRGGIAVIRSQQRMRDADGNETGGGVTRYRAHNYHCDGSDLAALYESWEAQKSLIAHWREIVFDDLKDHPLWVPASQRENFSHRQTG